MTNLVSWEFERDKNRVQQPSIGEVDEPWQLLLLTVITLYLPILCWFLCFCISRLLFIAFMNKWFTYHPIEMDFEEQLSIQYQLLVGYLILQMRHLVLKGRRYKMFVWQSLLNFGFSDKENIVTFIYQLRGMHRPLQVARSHYPFQRIRQLKRSCSVISHIWDSPGYTVVSICLYICASSTTVLGFPVICRAPSNTQL